MKKLLVALVLLLSACSSNESSSTHVITSINNDEIIVDGNILLDLNKNIVTYDNISVGDSVVVTNKGKIKEQSKTYELNDNYLYLDSYKILPNVSSISLDKQAKSLTKDLIFLKEDGDKLIFQDQTSIYSVEPISPLKIASLPLGAKFSVSYFKEADTKDYTLLSSVYEIKLIDDSKKMMYVNVINEENGIIVNNMYNDLYLLDNELDLHIGDRVLISYSDINGTFDKSSIYPTYKGSIIRGANLEETIIKANEKATYRVTINKVENETIYVNYNNQVYELVPENGFEFGSYMYMPNSYIKIWADKEIDSKSKKITGVYKVRVEA